MAGKRELPKKEQFSYWPVMLILWLLLQLQGTKSVKELFPLQKKVPCGDNISSRCLTIRADTVVLSCSHPGTAPGAFHSPAPSSTSSASPPYAGPSLAAPPSAQPERSASGHVAGPTRDCWRKGRTGAHGGGAITEEEGRRV